MDILCIIPARSGSKGIPHKNIKLFRGKPLLAWSIEQALSCKQKMRVIVSTDSEEYATIAKQYGAEIPFLRPSELSQDTSLTIDCINHCIDFLKDHENYTPDCIVLLQPTSPIRPISDIEACIDLFIKNRDNYDSLTTFTKVKKSPFKMFYYDSDDQFKPLFTEFNSIQEPYNKPRQLLPDVYNPNGSIYIFNTSLLNQNTITGSRVLPYTMEIDIDIDTPEDWKKYDTSIE